MVILRNELEDMKTESLLKYELQLKMFSRGKNRDTELKRPDFHLEGKTEKNPRYSTDWVDWAGAVKEPGVTTATLQRDSGGVNRQTELSMKARSQKLKAGSHPFLEPLAETHSSLVLFFDYFRTW